MKKKDLYKLKPGATLEVLWADAPPEVGLLLEKPEACKGDVCLKMFWPARGSVDSHLRHSQVVSCIGTCIWPSSTLPSEMRYIVPTSAKSKKTKKVKVVGKGKKKDEVKPADSKPLDPKLI